MGEEKQRDARVEIYDLFGKATVVGPTFTPLVLGEELRNFAIENWNKDWKCCRRIFIV